MQRKNSRNAENQIVLFCVFGVFFLRLSALFSLIPLIRFFFPNISAQDHAWLLAIYPCAQMFGQIPFGILADRIGPRKTLVLGSYCFFLSLLLSFLYHDSYIIFFLARLIQGFLALGAPAQLLLTYRAQDNQQLYARYYVIGLGVVGGIFGGFCFAAFAQSLHVPECVFLILMVLQVGLIFGLHWVDPSSDLSFVQTKRHYLSDFSTVFLDSKLRQLFLANILLHVIQTFVLGGSLYWPLEFRENPAFWMLSTFCCALVICASALRKRNLNFSLVVCLRIILLFLCLQGVFFVYPYPFFSITTLLIFVFVLLLLLEAGLGVGLKTLGYQQGSFIGLYNTFQYGAMTCGSLFLERISSFEGYQAFSIGLFGLLGLVLWQLHGTFCGIALESPQESEHAP